ncbi:MAG TPA: fibronectin type III-like domain-contianing protein, partial [Actinomycetota bacterium]
LSYTTFQTSGLSATASVSSRGTVTVRFTAANTGDRAGATVVPVYVHQPVSDVIAPDRRLVAFTRVELAAGQSRTVQVSFPVSRLAVTPADINGDGVPRVETGAYQVLVDNLTAPFTVNR